MQELTSEKITGEPYTTPLDKEASIHFYVAECMEFPVLGEFHENLTLQEAIELCQKIPADRMNSIKGIGFCLEDGSMYDGNFDLMSGGQVLKDIINKIPHYRESPLVQKAIADMETILSKQAEKPIQQPEKELEKETKKPQEPQAQNDKEMATSSVEKASELEKTVETVPKTSRDMSEGTNKKQSVLTALRERQAKLKATRAGKFTAEITGTGKRRSGIMMVRFEENKYMIMTMFQRESRQQTMEEIRSVLPFISEDGEILLLVNSALEKMGHLSDEAYLNLDLEPYQAAAAEDE